MPKHITKSTALKTTGALVAAVTTLAVTAFATAGEAEPTQGRPNLASLQALSIFDDSTAAAIPREDYELLASILPDTAEDGLLTRPDLAPESDGRTLMATPLGERYSAARMRSGQVCWIYRTSSAAVAGCAHELSNAGIDPSGMWNEQGQTLFGLADDTVARVQVRTNEGSTHAAPMGRNTYHWSSASPSREVYAVAIVVTHVDGSVDVVNLPDEDLAQSAAAT